MHNVASFIDLEAWIARVWQGQRVLIKPWFITFDFGTVNNGASRSVTQKVNSNADFVLVDYRTSAVGNPANVQIQLVDNGSLEQFFAEQVDLDTISKINNDGFNSVSTYRRIAGNSSVTATLYNNSGGNLPIAVTMSGVLVYPYSAARG